MTNGKADGRDRPALGEDGTSLPFGVSFEMVEAGAAFLRDALEMDERFWSLFLAKEVLRRALLAKRHCPKELFDPES